MNFIVFLPGTLCDERLWTYQTQVFKNYQIVNLRTQASMQDTVKVLADIPESKMALVGFSMGGYVAQEFALQYPDRVAKLVLIGSSAEGYPEDEKKLIRESYPIIQKGLFKGITHTRLKQFLHPDSYENRELRDLIRSMAGPDAASVYMNQLKATLDWPDHTEDLKKLACPILIIGGQDDQIIKPDSLRRTHQHLLQSQLHLIENCGHFVPLEKPEECNQILFDFLTDN